MNQKDIGRWLASAGDSRAELPARIKALEELSNVRGEGVRAQVRALWDRRRPAPAAILDYDPEGAERVVDMHIVLALHRLGDSSLVPELTRLVSQAGRVLQGPYSELGNAAKVVRAIGRSEPIRGLAALAATPKSAANAVRVLQMLGLPSPPTGGPVELPELGKPVSFTIHRWKEEMEQIVALSGGKIELSPGTRQLIAKGDYERGEVRRENQSLASVLMEELDILDVTYAVGQHGVTIITFEEAGPLWQQRIAAVR